MKENNQKKAFLDHEADAQFFRNKKAIKNYDASYKQFFSLSDYLKK